MTYRLPEKEYYKLYKMVRKLEQQANVVTPEKAVTFNRICKKVASIVNRAMILEDQMMVPKERRWTIGFQ